MRMRLLTTGSIFAAAGIATVLILGSASYRTGVKADGCTTNPVVINNADSGTGSLRQAIADACPGSTITFANTVVSPIVLQSELAIDETLTIQGPGASLLTISGNNAVRVFNIGGGIGNVAQAISVTLSGMTLSDGNAPDDSGLALGGCILNNSTGTLTITSATISNSTAQGVSVLGGGLFNIGAGTVDITNSTISGNSVGHGDGGGIGNASTACTINVTNSTIVGNSAPQGGGGAYVGQGTLNVTGSTISGNTARVAGGLFVSGGTVTVTGSTISGNTAALNGGGAEVDGTINLINSTISDNTATSSQGGGLYVNARGTLNLTNSTISGNSAGEMGGGAFGNIEGTLNLTNSTISGNSAGGMNGMGGGVFSEPAVPNLFPAAVVNTKNTIIALNTASSAGPDVDGSFISLGHNLIGEGDGSTGLTNGVNGDQVGSIATPLNPMLGPPANNGGATLTEALIEGSPAIDAGDDSVLGPPLSLTTDQRGPGFPRRTRTHVDIGAVAIGCPVIGATLTGGTIICPGGLATITITVTINGGLSPYTVTLNNGGGTMTGPSPLMFSVTPATSTTYSVFSGADLNTCPVTGMNSAVVTFGSKPAVTVNPQSQTVGAGTVTFTAAATGTPAPTVQWQMSTNGGGSFTNITGATNRTLTLTLTPSESEDEFRAVFTNQCGTATTNAALLTVFSVCLKDNATGNLLQWNSVTGQYKFTRCSDGFTLTGTGVVRVVNGIQTLTDS
ncbi:MAG: choice-of-anchor Q domain-containing protein, partial [Blastocatellia bacterium]